MIVVLGANGGIGSGLLKEAAALGDDQVMGVFRKDCDVESDESVDRFFSNLSRIRCDDSPIYAINATGNLVNGLLHKTEPEDIVKTINVNIAGAYRLARAFRVACVPGSSLILMSSVVGRIGVPGAASYGMCKAAMHGLVRSLSKEFCSVGARINVVEMGYFDVGMIDRIPEKHQVEIASSIPLRRFGYVEELWDLCRAVLVNGYMTGQVVPITGGL